jgi:hypothetical protein
MHLLHHSKGLPDDMRRERTAIVQARAMAVIKASKGYLRQNLATTLAHAWSASLLNGMAKTPT